MARYYEAHVTMLGDPAIVEPAVRAMKGWKFSKIDGDANLGDGVKCYATRQMNIRVGDWVAMGDLFEAARRLAEVSSVQVLRRKVEVVIFDDRSAKVQAACAGNCPECVGQE